MARLRTFFFTFLLPGRLLLAAAGVVLAGGVASAQSTTLLTLDTLGEPPLTSATPTDSAPPSNAWTNPQRLAPSTSDLRVTLDLSTRFIWDDARGEAANLSSVGLDLLHVFSGPAGDRATLTVQGYFTHDDTPTGASGTGLQRGEIFFEHRILNLNLTLLSRGRLNLRVGHFEIPHGLEQDLNTNGTLRQFTHSQNLGLKADWGASLNGVLHGVDYEAALTRGSGNEWLDRGDPWIASARVGVQPRAGTTLGLSVLSGEILLDTATVRRERVAVDAAQNLGPLTLLAEASVGRDENRDGQALLGELNWRTPPEDLLAYLQYRVFNRTLTAGSDPLTTAVVGARWAPDAHWALSAAVEIDTDAPAGLARGRRLVTQVRYRF